MGFLFEDMNLTEALFFCSRDSVGSICTATVDRVIPLIDAAFLSGPDGIPLFYQLKENRGRHIILRNTKKNRIQGEISVGDTLLVQIQSEAQKQKQMAATARLSLTGDAVVVNLDGTVGLSKKIKDPKRREEIKDLLEETVSEWVKEGEKEGTDPDPDFRKKTGFGVIARTSAEHVSAEYLRSVTIRLLCKLEALILSAKTTPEHRWLHRTGLTPEEYARELTVKGIYESVTVHTDLPWDCEGKSDGLREISPIREPKDVDPKTLGRLHKSEERMVQIDPANPGSGGYLLRRSSGKEDLLVIFNIRPLLEKALARKVFLKNGGYLYIDPTEAMTVIDVNSGKNIKTSGHEEGAMSQNLEAAREIARLLRLRNISGMIMIDFISMRNPEHERELLTRFRQMTQNDPCRVQVVDITKLGIVEVTREKKLPPLEEQMKRNEKND